MLTKLNHRLPQTADRRAEFETGVETELRERLKLTGDAGIVSVDGQDIDVDTAPCALSINDQDLNAIDVGAGTVVFETGEFVTVGSAEIASVSVDTAITDGQVFRLEYGEVDDGDLEANPYFNFAAPPKKRKKTAMEMLVVETVTAYNAQPSDVKEKSIVLGVVRVELAGDLVVDNNRDTYSFSRPWFTPQDTEHRSSVGTGSVTTNNPHGISFNDLTVGNYTAWQALVGSPACVLARPTGTGKFPGEICTETVPSGSFATDVTGLITGVAGALYAPLGFWPDRLLRCSLDSNSATQMASWIPKGRNLIAIFDPANFTVAADVDVVFTKVTGGALPSSLSGLQTVTVGQPTASELLIAGGNFVAALTEDKAIFTDVGLIPMKFDILVDGDGKVYKSPDVIYCNTLLETLGSTPQNFTIQPTAPSRLRVAISNYNTGYTEVRFSISGLDENGGNISETTVFSGPASGPVQTSFTEVIEQRLFTAAVFAQVNQIQATVRNGDGPNTTVTVFAEQSPERPGTEDDLLLGTVQWTGSEVNGLYGNDADVAIDRRIVTKGGGSQGLSPVSMAMNQPMLVETQLGYLPSGATNWATLVEDFNDPAYMEYPNDFVGVQTGQSPIELTSNSLGARKGYISRLIPFGQSIVSTGGSEVDEIWLRMLPRDMRGFPSRHSNNFQIDVTLYDIAGTTNAFVGSLGTNPYPPYQVQLTGGSNLGTWYGVQISMSSATANARDLAEAFQGFIFHIRA